MNLGRGKIKKYDLCVYFDANYLCTGSFYDSYEYFALLKQKCYDVCFVVLTVESEETVHNAILDKYVGDWYPDIFVFNRHEYLDTENIIPIYSNILFIPSMSAAAQMLYYHVLIPKNKIITIWELPPDHKFISAFDKYIRKDKILMLYDERIFNPARCLLYAHEKYTRSIYFDLMRPHNKCRESTMFTMVTDHKCYEVDDLYEIMAQYNRPHYTIFTKEQWFEKYSVLESNQVEVIKTPCMNYMSLFDEHIYLPSLRHLDPSPRLIPECKWFDKKIIYHDFPNVSKDGGYWRYKDTKTDFNSLVMKPNDKIIDYIEYWRKHETE